jgi:outer membrane protein assembly factor BamD (BamD/ComL family)
MGRKRSRQGKHLHLFLACLILIGISGCAGFQGMLAKPDYWQANQQLASGNYETALEQYRQINQLYPKTADEALFKIGCIYAHPKNPKRDYQKSLDVFRQLVSEHPRSAYREPADVLIAILGELASRDKELMNRDRGAPALRRQVDSLEKQVETLQKQIEQMKEIDRSLEEKRRTMPPRK